MIDGYVSTVLAAGWVTLLLGLASLVLAVLFGLGAALCKLSGNRLLRAVATLYTTVVRGIPDLVMMLLIYYSLPAFLNELLQSWGSTATIQFSPLGAGIFTLGLIFGAYMTETFRGAIVNIPRGQIEAAAAFGLSRGRTVWRIMLPQMARLALPGFANNWLVLAKATALASLLGVEDLMFRTRGAAEATGRPFTFYLIAAAFYLAITCVSLLLLHLISRRLALGLRDAVQ